MVKTKYKVIGIVECFYNKEYWDTMSIVMSLFYKFEAPELARRYLEYVLDIFLKRLQGVGVIPITDKRIVVEIKKDIFPSRIYEIPFIIKGFDTLVTKDFINMSIDEYHTISEYRNTDEQVNMK